MTKITSDRATVEQALEALDDERYVTKYTHIVEAIAALKAAMEQEQALKKLADLGQEIEQEPFGYFRADAFGWTDCAETDENAKALYEYPFK